MTPRPIIFISATSDLRSARSLVGEVLFSMGYEPHWQDIEPTDGGELLAVLRRWIDPSSLVIQLVGQRYGAEPPGPTEQFGRISYTQFEALYADKLGKKVIYHFIDPSFPTNSAPPEAEELTQLQVQYKEGLVAANKLRHGSIASTHELELSIRRISAELAAIRAQSDRRYRRLAGLIAASLAGIVVVVGLTLQALRQQSLALRHQTSTSEQTAQIKAEMDAMRSELRAAVAPQPLAANQTQPDPLPPALLEKARILLERGDAADQALAKIALQQHDEADRIIQELKSKPDNPIDEAARLLTMEGDNWYQAGQPDKSLKPYEQALGLRPTDVQLRTSVAISHTSARRGNTANHRRRAIEVAEGTLGLVSPNSAEWALTQDILGTAWANLPTGDAEENFQRAIEAYQAALTVRTKEAYPAEWATTMNNLGGAWVDMPTGDQGENLQRAIDAFDAALTVRSKEANPDRWAATQSNLGAAWSALPSGDHTANMHRAIGAFEAALTVQSKEVSPEAWATTQVNLGTTWSDLRTGDQEENFRRAISALEGALTVYTKEAYPAKWARTQYNLGIAWAHAPTGDLGENLQRAIDAYEAALTVQSKEADPLKWAATQHNLGTALANVPTGDRNENLQRAITAFEAALTVKTKEAFPADWASTQKNLAIAWAMSSELPGPERCSRLLKAIACGKAALRVRTPEALPRDHADTVHFLKKAQAAYESAGCTAQTPFDEIPPAK